MRTTRMAPTKPYVDIELRADADRGQLSLVRCVAAEVGLREGADEHHVDEIRDVAGCVAAALVLLAPRGAQMRCLFRVLDRQVRIRVEVPAAPSPTAEAKAVHARLLDGLEVWTSAATEPDGSGGRELFCDALVSLSE